MSIISVDYGTISGGSAEWITPTLSNSNKTATCSWGYDADTLILLYTFNNGYGNKKCVHLYDVSNNTVMWYSNENDKWAYYTAVNWITLTARSLVFNCPQNIAMTDVTVIPIKGKPNGYFA